MASRSSPLLEVPPPKKFCPDQTEADVFTYFPEAQITQMVTGGYALIELAQIIARQRLLQLRLPHQNNRH